MPRRVRIIAITVGIVGLVAAIGCAVTLYAAGTVIDEQQIDPGFRLLPLFAGIAVGILAGFGIWIVGYIPADRSSRHD
jgi:hypothetical protein